MDAVQENGGGEGKDSSAGPRSTFPFHGWLGKSGNTEQLLHKDEDGSGEQATKPRSAPKQVNYKAGCFGSRPCGMCAFKLWGSGHMTCEPVLFQALGSQAAPCDL